MERKDLRNQIISTRISNTDEKQNMGNKDFDTTDLIYLDSKDEQFDNKHTDEERRVSSTDYAKMNNAYTYINYKTRTGKNTTYEWLRSASNRSNVHSVYGDGDWNYYFTKYGDAGLCPSFHHNLPSNISARSATNFFTKKHVEAKTEDNLVDTIKEVKDENGNVIYHTIEIGEYPKNKADEDLSRTLELLYHGGKIKENLSATGRWFSTNGQKQDSKDYAGKHSPEFEYNKERYARVISYPSDQNVEYSDGIKTGKEGIIRWVKVEPISFVIKNWDEMPKSINIDGNGNAKYFDLRAEEAIISNIPFYPESDDKNSSMWQNSNIRGYFNGIDVRNITENGNPQYGASRGGNYKGECNFLNEAFNLTREPIKEYVIPESETEIPDDAFNGCVTLEKLIIHSNINSIGKNAFDGLDFKYAYRQKTGEIVFDQKLSENIENIENIIEINKISKSFIGFDYNILIQGNELKQVTLLADKLNKNNFSIPYVFSKQLIDSENVNSFCENSDFRFFKNEIPDINDKLLDFPDEEKLDFYKFACALGCFSTQKMLDKQGKETEAILAQKATSTLLELLKTEEMKLR